MTVPPSADVAASAELAANATIWHLAQVRENAVIGPNCIIGRGAYIGTGVRLGANCKIQNHALVYEPAVLADGVFVGPGAIFTNDHHPRAINADGSLKSSSDWDAVGVTCETGASIGAGAICIAPITLGAWSMIGSGSVVTRDVVAYALMVGTPARQIGWVGPAGQRLTAIGDGLWECPATGGTFREDAGILTPVPMDTDRK